MRIKDDTEPYYLVDFCRKKDCQQITVIETSDEEIKSFLCGIFENKRKRGNANIGDGTIVRVRRIEVCNARSDKILYMPIYNLSPSQARIYTAKCMAFYFKG